MRGEREGGRERGEGAGRERGGGDRCVCMCEWRGVCERGGGVVCVWQPYFQDYPNILLFTTH